LDLEESKLGAKLLSLLALLGLCSSSNRHRKLEDVEGAGCDFSPDRRRLNTLVTKSRLSTLSVLLLTTLRLEVNCTDDEGTLVGALASARTV